MLKTLTRTHNAIVRTQQRLHVKETEMHVMNRKNSENSGNYHDLFENDIMNNIDNTNNVDIFEGSDYIDRNMSNKQNYNIGYIHSVNGSTKKSNINNSHNKNNEYYNNYEEYVNHDNMSKNEESESYSAREAYFEEHSQEHSDKKVDMNTNTITTLVIIIKTITNPNIRRVMMNMMNMIFN